MINQTDAHINYPKLVDQAMRDIAKKVLNNLTTQGIKGEHYFMISFITSNKNVRLSSRLKERYPNEMTIVLQHQFEDLTIDEEKIGVRLSFDGIKEIVEVPFDAFTSFVDPSANFALQFNPEFIDKDERDNIINIDNIPKISYSKKENSKHKDSKILVLDNFRKK